MGEIAVGRGNWANASARSKARKANLLNETQMRQLMQQGPDTIAASIADAGYSKELNLYSVERKSFKAYNYRNRCARMML